MPEDRRPSKAFPFNPRSSGDQPRPSIPDPGTETAEESSGGMDPTRIEPPSSSGGGVSRDRVSRIQGGPDSRAAIPVQKGSAGERGPGEIPEALRQIGPYRVERVLARGGMGAVYLGHDDALGRTVAIKTMAPELIEDEDAVARFQREGRATASIVHPNVAMIYMVGMADDGSPFIAMEYVGGGNLQQLIRERKRLPFSEVAAMMLQTCEALNEARKKGIIHRDIKPGNIMLAPDGTVKLVDFGLAKFFREDSFRTVAGTILGTPRYMSPEQAQGREVDFRSDIYALGATFFHLLTGRPPFEGDSPSQIMMKHVTSPLVSMRSLNPEVPLEFDDIVRRCMSKDPNERYQDYLDLISELSRLRLQWHARERGSLDPSMHEMPTVRTGPDGIPLPPDATSSSPRSAVGTLTMEEGPAEGEKVPAWRIAIIVGAALLAVVLIGSLFFIGGGEGEDAAPPQGQRRSGLALLLEQIVAQQQDLASNDTSGKAIDPDYLRYLATIEILEDLHYALITYEFENGAPPPDLITLVASGSSVVRFDTNNAGHPLDGWSRSLDYSSRDGEIRSPGLDQRLDTDDDIVITSEGTITIRNRRSYERLEDAEGERLE